MNELGIESDRCLLRAARKGDSAAVAALIERHFDQARRIAHGILDDTRWADDVTHEAIHSIVGKVGRLDPYRPFAPRLHRVVSRRARGWARVRESRASHHFQTQMEVNHA